MLYLNGSIYIVTEKMLLQKNMYNINTRNTILCMDEQESELYKIYGDECIPATVLLPPPDAVYCQIDGNMDGFINGYNNWLYSDTVQEYIGYLMLLLHSGVNIFLYIPDFDNESIWCNILLNFFAFEYGLIIGTDINSPFINNDIPDIKFKRASIMYLCDCISMEDFIQYIFPAPIIFRDNMIPSIIKLGKDLIHKYPNIGDTPQSIYDNIKSKLMNPNSRCILKFGD